MVEGAKEFYQAVKNVGTEIFKDMIKTGPKGIIEFFADMLKSGKDTLDYLAEKFPYMVQDVETLRKYLKTEFPRKVDLARMKTDFNRLERDEKVNFLLYGLGALKDELAEEKPKKKTR